MIAMVLSLIALADPTGEGTAPAISAHGVTLDRLPALLEALTETTGRPAVDATFADLWHAPTTRIGEAVRVRGTIRRRFRQGPLGAFPALTETWITDEQNQPLVLISPARGEDPPLVADAEFSGSYLGLIRYRGSDTDRLAPLVAGPSPPVAVRRPGPEAVPIFPSTYRDWAVGVIVAGIAAGMIALAHLRTPRPRPTPPGAPPRFVDPDDVTEPGP